MLVSKRFACALILVLLCWPGRSTLGLLDERDLVPSAQIQPFSWHVRSPWKLAPRPTHTIEARPPAAVEPPDVNSSEQVRAALEAAPTSAHAPANVIELKARLDDAARRLSHAEQLCVKDLIPQSELDAFRTAVADAETDLAAGEAGIVP